MKRGIARHPMLMLRAALFACVVAASAHAEGAAAEAVDRVAPEILDISIAADNPLAPAVISIRATDNVGVASAVAHWRVAGAAWAETAFAGSGPLYLARLPDGPQKAGFSLWIELKDAAGNVGHIGSEGTPLDVAAAVEGNEERVARQIVADNAFRGPHPAWVMLALGTGIAASAGAGVFVYDLNVLGHKGEVVDDLLADDGLSDQRRAELENTRTAIDNAAVQDTALVGVLGVVGGAALATGVVLLTISAVEQ